MADRATKTYGLHLMIDGYGADPRKLDDVGLLFETLDGLPALIGMHKIGFPHIAQFKQTDIAGISGIIMIMESHISVHTYSKKGFFSMDVYSCKRFEHEKVIETMRQTYVPDDLEIVLVDRGKKFPMSDIPA